MLLVGLPGVCKSSLGYSLNTLFLAFDPGAHRAVNRRAETFVPESWDDVVAQVTRSRLFGVDAVTIDTVERAVRLLALALCEESSTYGVGGNLTPKGWGVLKQRFGAWLDQFRAWGKDVVLVAHAKEERRTRGTVIRADIPGGSYDEVLRQADFVGFLHLVGSDRVVDFNPCDRWVGKNPAAWPALKVPPVERAETFLGDLITRGRAALNEQRAESAALASEVDGWRAEVASYREAPQFNAALARVADLPVVLQPQVKQLLWRRSKELPVRFDEQLRQFVPAPTVERPRSSRAASWQPRLDSVLTTTGGAR